MLNKPEKSTDTAKKEQTVRGILVPLSKKDDHYFINTAIKADGKLYYVRPKGKGKDLQGMRIQSVLATGIVSEDKEGDLLINVSRYIFLD